MFFILFNVIFLVRLGEKFEIDYFWEWKVKMMPLWEEKDLLLPSAFGTDGQTTKREGDPVNSIKFSILIYQQQEIFVRGHFRISTVGMRPFSLGKPWDLTVKSNEYLLFRFRFSSWRLEPVQCLVYLLQILRNRNSEANPPMQQPCPPTWRTDLLRKQPTIEDLQCPALSQYVQTFGEVNRTSFRWANHLMLKAKLGRRCESYLLDCFTGCSRQWLVGSTIYQFVYSPVICLFD